MSERRRMLMAIVNQYKWLPYSFEYLYHDLIPQTISSKSVQNQAKVSKIYGNSVVENQLCPYLVRSNVDGITFSMDSSTGKLTVNGTTLGSQINTWVQYSNSTRIAGHKYLYSVKMISGSVDVSQKTTSNITSGYRWTANLNISQNFYFYSAGQRAEITSETTGSTTAQFIRIGYDEGVVFTNAVFQFMCIDLTQKFPFDTPTTLTDKRVQALLNRGYIPFNTGEIKSVDIGEFESEPYNIWDEQWEIGGISTTTGENDTNTNRIRSINYISVLDGQSYTFESQSGTFVVCMYDCYKNYLGYFEPLAPYTLPNNCAYIRFRMSVGYGTTYNNDICIHRTGTRTGYAPYQAFSPLSFKYQGNGVGTAHDTMEITKTGYVFTKAMSSVDLGSLSFNDIGNSVFYALLSTVPSDTGQGNKPNLLCPNYDIINAQGQSTWINNETRDKVMSLGYDTARIYLRNTSISQASDVTGTLEYELATPQVITIPRKHLGIVDLGSLNWFVSGNKMASSDLQGIAKNVADNQKANAYCYLYIIDTTNNVYNETTNKTLSIANNGRIYVYDSAYTNATDFKNAMAGVYLFYETQDEVADVLDTIDIEAGGTITSDSDVLPNVEFKIKCK